MPPDLAADRAAGADRGVVSVILPHPPNIDFRKAVGAGEKLRARRSRYLAWRRRASRAVERQGVGPILAPVAVEVVLIAANGGIRDLAALADAAIMLLTEAGVVDPGRLVRPPSVRWAASPPAKPGALVVHLEQRP